MIDRLISYITKAYPNSKQDTSNFSAIMLVISRWAATLSALFLAMVLTRIIERDLYGMYAKLWLVYFIFGQVLISTIAAVSLQRISASNQPKLALQIAVQVALFAALLIATVVYLVAPKLAIWINAPTLTPSIRAFIPYIAFSILTSPMEAIFIHLKKRKDYLFFTVFFHVSNGVVAILGFIVFTTLYKVVLFMSLIPLLRLFYMGYSMTMVRVSATAEYKTNIKRIEWNAIAGLAGVLMMGTLLSVASKDLDRWIVANYISDQAEFALYAIGAKKVPLIAGLTSSISAALVAHYSSTKRGEVSQLLSEKIHKHVNRFFGPIILVIFYVAFNAENILNVLYGEMYVDAAPFFRWYQWALIGDLIFGLTIFLVAEDKKRIFWISISEFSTNLVLSILGMMYIGPTGVIMATVFSHISFSLLAVFVGCKTYDIPFKHFFPTSSRVLKVAVLVVLVVLITMFTDSIINPISAVASFGLASLLYGITGLIMLRKLT